MTDADQIALWALNAAELLKRAIAKSAYPAADGTADIDNDAIPILAAALEHHHARGRTAGFNEAKERDWLPIDADAKTGKKVELVIRDVYADPPNLNVTIGYFDEGRWWGSGISSHWQPALYRPIDEALIATALLAMKQGGSDD